MPEHVVTFLLTEVVDSIRRWEQNEATMSAATDSLDAIVDRLVSVHRGTLVKPRGEGDSHFLVFSDPSDAVACAVALQRAVQAETGLPLRSASHVGAAEFRGGDWYGTTVNRCARLRAAAQPGQSLVSEDVARLVGATRNVDTGISLRSLGRHRLKDLDDPTEVFQICAEGLVEDHPPLVTLAQSHGLELPRSSFVGRSAECADALRYLDTGAVVMVSGPPGAGTTRFAREVAARWWEASGKSVREVGATESYVHSRHSDGELLVISDPAAGFDPASVTGPAIVTTRRPHHLAGGALVRLGPLGRLDAQRLLADRVPEEVAVDPSLAAWCDGLPLALELLARRATSVDGTVLAQRLAADPLAILGGDRRAEPRRHSSVHATFAAAFEALDAQEQSGLLSAEPGDQRWVEAGWHEQDGPLPLVDRFLAALRNPG